MVVQRHRDGSPPWRFADLCLVVCPRCAGMARIAWAGGDTRLTCPLCALVRQWDGRLHPHDETGERCVVERSRHTGSWLDVRTGRRWRGGDLMRSGDRDPYFGLPLWLRSECCGGHTLWAYNEDHLTFLRDFIAARLRERPVNHPRTFTWRLPTWMKDAKHREELLRHIDRLQQTL